MRVGRIAGFDLSIHWSTVVIFTLLVLSLSTVRFPESAPGLSEGAYLVAAVLTGLAFYASLIAHEVSHAVMARREGIEVSGLTLWMLGGVASLSGEPRDPGADLRIAGIGPAVSLALGAVFGALTLAAEAAGAPDIVQATLAWLAGINAVLALFNLIPAAPLDGGRVLRAILWRVRRDRTWAAVTAARAGSAFGYLLVALGLAQLFFGGGIGGLWFVLLGWFVLNAARSEQAQAILTDALGDVRVGSVMSPDPVTVPDYITVQALLDDYVLRTRHSAFPMTDLAGRPTGLVTLGQVRGVPPGQRDDVRVREVACDMEGVPVAGPEDRLVDLLPKLNSCAQGRALVLQGGRLVGIVTPADVARALEVATLDRPSAGGRERRDDQVVGMPPV